MGSALIIAELPTADLQIFSFIQAVKKGNPAGAEFVKNL